MVPAFRAWRALFVLRMMALAQFASSFQIPVLIGWAIQSPPPVGN